MGEHLRRTAISTNIKERLDFSCALLDAEGRLVVNAPHIPVHLGALGLCVRTLRQVVARLFALVQPDAAIFGQKDYQQQLVIRHMTEDLNLPIKIVTGATVREDDGLAMSSRNSYLSEEERATAPELYATLSHVGNDLQNGRRNFPDLEAEAAKRLAASGFDVDYFAIRRAVNLEIPDRDCDDLVVLAAARLGKARLIDNIVVTI